MLKDRAQKATALRMSVSKQWLPQLEVDVEPDLRVEKTKFLLTDLDVLAVAQSPIGGHTRLVFDCKSSAKESAISRTFWLHGVMTRSSAAHGFVVLNDKVVINRDHRISASELSITLVHDSEFQDFATGVGGSTAITDAAVANIDVWEQFLAIATKYGTLRGYLDFAKSTYWMTKDPGERCRKTLARLRSIRTELDPAKAEHLAVFGDALCLFLLALSEISNRLFLVLLRPSSEDEFSSSLLAYLYGGYQSLEAAQKIRKITSGAGADDAVSIFPEQERFELLVRELLQAPQQVIKASLLARELSFASLGGSGATALQTDLVQQFAYSPKFVLMAAEYLQKASLIPPEFAAHYGNLALTLASGAIKKKVP